VIMSSEMPWRHGFRVHLDRGIKTLTFHLPDDSYHQLEVGKDKTSKCMCPIQDQGLAHPCFKGLLVGLLGLVDLVNQVLALPICLDQHGGIPEYNILELL
jgi:hypothetical protein